MSLFGSIQLANNALQANQIGLQVVGQNIANANTPGYSRAELDLTPAPTQKFGTILLGLGVEVRGIVQKIDRFLEERLRASTSDRASSEAQEKAYQQLEGVLGELKNTGLGSSLQKFFASIQEVLNQPESAAARNIAVLQGQALAADVRALDGRVTAMRQDLNSRIDGAVLDANRLLQQIRKLNVQIASIEGGPGHTSDAVGLRDQRNQALAELSELLQIRVEEQPNGAANVYLGGDFLVFEGEARTLAVQKSTDRGIAVSSVIVKETQAALPLSGGQLAGLAAARDEILGSFQDRLDTFVGALAFEFNKVFSGGQGLTGYQSLTSTTAVNDPAKALDAAGLKFAPASGSFQVLVQNKQTGATTTSAVAVDLNGLDANDTTLQGLAQALGAISGLSASVTPEGRLKLNVTSPDLQFAFADDSSGVLAALGLNTFFTGSTAKDLDVSQTILGDPSKFAVSRSGIAGDTANALLLAGLLDRPLDALGGTSIGGLYAQLSSDVTQASATTHSVAEAHRSFESSLKGQQLAVSGVSLDEEAVKLITYQRAFQASARYIATLNDLLDSLVRL